MRGFEPHRMHNFSQPTFSFRIIFFVELTLINNDPYLPVTLIIYTTINSIYTTNRETASSGAKIMRYLGIEPKAQPWKGYMLPLHQ